MTIANKVEQALASAKSLEANLQTFGLDTNNQQAKQTFQQLQQSANDTVKALEQRLQEIRTEEPQYNQVQQ